MGLAAGDREVLAAVLEAYGIDPAEPGLAQRLLGMALIHQHADLARWVQSAPEPTRASLDTLAEHWFGAT